MEQRQASTQEHSQQLAIIDEAVQRAVAKTTVSSKLIPIVPWDPTDGPPSPITILSDSLVAQMPSECWSDIVMAVVEARAKLAAAVTGEDTA